MEAADVKKFQLDAQVHYTAMQNWKLAGAPSRKLTCWAGNQCPQSRYLKRRP